MPYTAPTQVITNGTLTHHQFGPIGSYLGTFPVARFGAVGDGVTNDATAIQAAITAAAAAGGGVVYVPAGTYAFTGVITVSQFVDIRGDGGAGSAAATRGGSVLLATGSTAQLRFAGRGGVSEGFLIHGGGVANATGGLLYIPTGVTQRTFTGIEVSDSAGDGLVVESAQNNTFVSCNIVRHLRHGITLDKGCGGNAFFRVEVSKAGGYLCRVIETTGLGPYENPEHNSFYHCIFERAHDSTATCSGVLQYSAGEQNSFDNCIFSLQDVDSIVGADHLIQATGGYFQLHNCRISGGLVHSGIRQEAGVGIFASGTIRLKNLPTAWTVNGGFGHVPHIEYGGVTTKWAGAGFSNLYDQSNAAIQVLSSGNQLARLRQTADTADRLQVNSTGQLIWGDGTATGDVNLLRNAANVLRTNDEFVADLGVRVGSGTGPRWSSGTGTPEGVVTAPVGSLFSRTDGGAATTLYIKQTGASNTGWAAVTP